jgi:hypothetical protein
VTRTACRLVTVLALAALLSGCSLAARFHVGDVGVALGHAGLAMNRIGSHVSIAID